jgi:hypothetical protein
MINPFVSVLCRVLGDPSLTQTEALHRLREQLHHLRRPALALPRRPRRTELPSTRRRLLVCSDCTATPSPSPAIADADRRSGRIRKVTADGLYIDVDRALPLGALLTLEIPRGDRSAPVTLLACVLRLNPRAKGEWTADCSLSCDPGREGDRQPAGLAVGIGVNYTCEPRAFRPRSSALTCDHWPVELVKVSIGGMTILAPGPVRTGSLLTVELREADGTVRQNMLAVVVASQLREGRRLVECIFIRELNEQELLDWLPPAWPTVDSA